LFGSCLVLVWFFLWLPEEELTLLFLLHSENGDFSLLMKDISFLLVSELFFHLLLLHQLHTKTSALWNLEKNLLQVLHLIAFKISQEIKTEFFHLLLKHLLLLKGEDFSFAPCTLIPCF
jgi:hypothetical protein